LPHIAAIDEKRVGAAEAMSSAISSEDSMQISARPRRWHILVFLLPAFIVYSAVMILPLIETLRLSLFNTVDGHSTFVGFANFQVLFGDERWAADFWRALKNNFVFFAIHMLVQNPLGIALAAMLSIPKLRLATFYRTAIFLPTILSFVIVGFIWKLILSPIWGITPFFMDLVGLKAFFGPWLGKPGTALITVSLISVWQNVGIPMMLIYAALLNIPDEVIEAAECDGITGWSQFWKIKLPLILPAIGMVSILTFVGNFNAFDLDLHGAGRARRTGRGDRYSRNLALPHLLRLPAAAR
jgi:raffinose/stachyose/melibiose transport system permease protein